jgi:S-methylmethionine-dependent homocysteine/selenocysteine methylase
MFCWLLELNGRQQDGTRMGAGGSHSHFQNSQIIIMKTKISSSQFRSLVTTMRRELKLPELTIMDGGTGEELFARGVPDDRKIWSATAVVNPQYHGTLKEVHRSFVDAGAHVVTTNSYGIVPGVGFTEEEIIEYCGLAGKLAREAVDGTDALVFGSLGPLVESYRADKIMEHNQGTGYYKKMAKALLPHVDAFLVETMSCVEESMQALDAVASNDNSVPCFVSYTLNSQGDLRSGEPVIEAITRLLDFCQEKRLHIFGVLFNCSEPEAITKALLLIKAKTLLKERLDSSGVRLGAYANRLTPVVSDWSLETSDGAQTMRKDVGPLQYYQDFCSVWTRDLNVKMVGGCCGITPEHIALLRDRLIPANKGG